MKFKSIPNSEMKSIKAGSNKWWDKAQDTFWTLEGKGVGRMAKLKGQLDVANAKAAHGQKP
ncbi:hypothetical protein K4U32_12260 [Staphylococcus epidermidis]|uniref:hypothetical protein n=1 Tax=Bacteria TaxID=2 RepID=UPI00026BF290|nr:MULTISPECIES: hypothetical protein [Bacteria]EJD89628.1 hypothetical protein HMPREF9992_00030 [Staphylococcus epidermidis NIHLM070]MDU1247711.1 hypothetical protein [Veillonella sp.]MDU1333411.1 hypothetical protein [Enterobacter hormaechei]EJE25706.1 hypothetical protein HMPREF9976_01330 [Staphylococcus epidermidis NIHLM003]MBF2203533.1 hypothetical protein [Staphylococcus epidermidis]